MAVKMRFLGVAAYEFITEDGKGVLMDPYIDGSPLCPLKSTIFDKVDLIIVSHAHFDQLGDIEDIASRTGSPVVCGGEINNFLVAKGMPSGQIQATVAGIAIEKTGLKVYPVENHHWSQIKMPDGSFASGVPTAYVLYFEDHIRFYHCGDTALFRDFSLIRDIHHLTHGCLGITNAPEILDMLTGPGKIVTAEMSPMEGALSTEWPGLHTAFPCHYYDEGYDDVLDYMERIKKLQQKNSLAAPKAVALSPGEWYTLEPVTGWLPLYQ